MEGGVGEDAEVSSRRRAATEGSLHRVLRRMEVEHGWDAICVDEIALPLQTPIKKNDR